MPATQLLPTATQAVSPSPDAARGRGCGLDKRGADAQLDIARTAIRQGDLRSAQVAIIAALKLHPGLTTPYRELGLLLEGLGLPKGAERCFQGVIPDFVEAEWFRDRYTIGMPQRVDGADMAAAEGTTPGTTTRDVPSADARRFVCHEPLTRELRAPKGISAPTDSMFERADMTSTLALVDHAPNGTLWFDGFNRVMLDGQGRLIEQHTRGNPSLIKAVTADARPHHIDGRAFFVGNRGYNNYYHWMLDILPSIDLFEKAGFELGPDDRIVVFAGESGFQKATLAHLGFAPEQVIQMSRVSPWISAAELIVPFYLNGMALTMGDWVPTFLKEKFLSGPVADLPPMPKIYLARAQDARNGRSIDNEAEMIALLEARGFTTVYPEHHGIAEQAAIFAGARTVLAPHGAGLTNIAFCAPGTQVIELYGNFMASCYWALSEVCGLDYYNHCCSTTERSIDYADRSHKNLHELRQRGFSVDLDELDALLDKAANS